MKVKRNKQSYNKKVMNAKRLVVDDIQFRSKLEAFCYQKLKENGIDTEYEKRIYTILEGFDYKGDYVRPITYKPDFTADDFILECKGYPNDAWPIRLKLWKQFMNKYLPNVDYYIPRNQKQILDVIELIKQKRHDKQQST